MKIARPEHAAQLDLLRRNLVAYFFKSLFPERFHHDPPNSVLLDSVSAFLQDKVQNAAIQSSTKKQTNWVPGNSSALSASHDPHSKSGSKQALTESLVQMKKDVSVISSQSTALPPVPQPPIPASVSSAPAASAASQSTTPMPFFHPAIPAPVNFDSAAAPIAQLSVPVKDARVSVPVASFTAEAPSHSAIVNETPQQPKFSFPPGPGAIRGGRGRGRGRGRGGFAMPARPEQATTVASQYTPSNASQYVNASVPLITQAAQTSMGAVKQPQSKSSSWTPPAMSPATPTFILIHQAEKK